MQVALFQPDIPQNTGTILRLCACLDVPAHIIEPAGFRPSLPPCGHGLPRSGIDHPSRFLAEIRTMAPRQRLSPDPALDQGVGSYLDYRYKAADILLFGRESAGVTDEVVAAADARLVIPIKPGLRSLNVAMAAAMALGEALRQTSS